MNNIQQNYIDTFNKVGTPLLSEYGFKTELSVVNESVNVQLEHEWYPTYLLTFSIHHLDYDQGVFIYKSSNQKLNHKEIILPSQLERKKGRIYNYTGKNLESEIIRLINDFRYYNIQMNTLSGRPFLYCSSDSTSKNITCDNSKLVEVENDKLGTVLKQESQNRKTTIQVLKCNECKGLWKQSTDSHNRKVSLKIGEVSDSKYFDENQRSYKEHQWKHFPLTQFTIQEALLAGVEISCGQFLNIDNYYGLSCSPLSLKHIKSISTAEQVGYPVKVDVFQCSSCNQLYEITEEYDSHRGTRFDCKHLESTNDNTEKKVANTVYSKKGNSWFKKLFRK